MKLSRKKTEIDSHTGLGEHLFFPIKHTNNTCHLHLYPKQIQLFHHSFRTWGCLIKMMLLIWTSPWSSHSGAGMSFAISKLLSSAIYRIAGHLNSLGLKDRADWQYNAQSHCELINSEQSEGIWESTWTQWQPRMSNSSWFRQNSHFR